MTTEPTEGPQRTITFYFRGRRPDGTGGDYDIGGSGLRVHILENEGVYTLSTSLPGRDRSHGFDKNRRQVEQFSGEFDSPLDALRGYAQAYGYAVANVVPRRNLDLIQILPPGNVPSERECSA